MDLFDVCEKFGTDTAFVGSGGKLLSEGLLLDLYEASLPIAGTGLVGDDNSDGDEHLDIIALLLCLGVVVAAATTDSRVWIGAGGKVGAATFGNKQFRDW